MAAEPSIDARTLWRHEREPRSEFMRLRMSPAERDALRTAVAVSGLRTGEYLRKALAAVHDAPLLASASHGNRTELFKFRATLTETESWRARAEAAGVSCSDYVRIALLRASSYEPESKQLLLKLSPETAAELTTQAESKQLPLADYVVQRVAQEGAVGKEVASGRASAALVMKLNSVKLSLDRVGNNVNQLARAVHLGRRDMNLWQEQAAALAAERRRAMEVLEEVAERFSC